MEKIKNIFSWSKEQRAAFQELVPILKQELASDIEAKKAFGERIPFAMKVIYFIIVHDQEIQLCWRLVSLAMLGYIAVSVMKIISRLFS